MAPLSSGDGINDKALEVVFPLVDIVSLENNKKDKKKRSIREPLKIFSQSKWTFEVLFASVVLFLLDSY